MSTQHDMSRRNFLKTAALMSVFPTTGGLSLQQGHAIYDDYDDVLAITADGCNDPYPVLKNKTGLKIQKIETFHKGSTLGLVKLTADNGSAGWGQVSTYDADISIEVLHRKIAQHFLGEDPADLGILVDRAIEANYKYPWSYVCRALSGVDTAVWDLLGKHESQSVCVNFWAANHAPSRFTAPV